MVRTHSLTPSRSLSLTLSLSHSLTHSLTHSLFGTKSKKQFDIPLNLNVDESQDSLKDNPSLDHYNASEQFIIEFLLEKENKCWQSDIVKNSDMTKSKISRTLSSLESKGLISRVRDGMGNRVILDDSELF